MALKNVRASYWSITAFNDVDIATLQSNQFPHWVRTVAGGLEKCPKTGSIHFQGFVRTEQVRGSAVLKWLPKAHIEKAIDPGALKNYAMKKDTAVGEKNIVENKIEYLSTDVLLSRIAMHVEGFDMDSISRECSDVEKCFEAEYWFAVRKMLNNNYSLYSKYLNAFANPANRTLWKKLREVFVSRSSSITDRLDSDVSDDQTDRQTNASAYTTEELDEEFS